MKKDNKSIFKILGLSFLGVAGAYYTLMHVVAPLVVASSKPSGTPAEDYIQEEQI